MWFYFSFFIIFFSIFNDLGARFLLAQNQPQGQAIVKQTELQRIEGQLSKLTEKVDELKNSIDKKDIEIAELKAKIDSTKNGIEIAELKAKIETTNTWLEIAGSFLGVIFALGTGFSVYSWFLNEQRAKQAFVLAISGEKDSQVRAAQVHQDFLGGSRETLELVNSTLQLAKEASERAANIMNRKAKELIEKLDRDSKSLLESVPKDDDRALIATSAARSKLRTLAQRIAGFEINRFVLPDDIRLTPPAMFIRAMEHHLEQHFDEAINTWRDVALEAKDDSSLQSLAWYWIGYEKNNLNEFAEAESSFDNALRLSSGARRYELQRILLESRFFKEKKNSKSLVMPFQNLLERINEESNKDEHAAYKRRIAVTVGNVLSQAGHQAKNEGNQKEALHFFSSAKKVYGEVQDDKWGLFGFAEMCHELNEGDNVQGFFQKVRQYAKDESVRREEYRTKVLARTTELICCLRIPELHSQVDTIRGLVEQDLGRVDERLTVYSQMRKRNVTKREFEEDLKILMSELVSDET